MIYSNGDIYEGQWKNDLKHGYGILERKLEKRLLNHIERMKKRKKINMINTMGFGRKA
jgi:hypothetical protein